MIDQSLFSNDWYQPSLPREKSAPVLWGIEKLGVGFISQKNGVAIQDVYRSQDFNKTKAEYFDRITATGWFHSDQNATEWYVPSDFIYKSPVANNYRFSCQTHKPSGVQSCQFVAQYEVYLLRFHTDMSEIMTYNDLERILRSIDDKMAQCLDK